MRILYLHQYFVPPGGAGSTRSYEFARRWVRRGHEVTVVTSSARFPEGVARGGTELNVEGIRVRVVDVPYSNELSYARRLVRFARFATAALAEVSGPPRADVVFASSTPLTIAIPALWAKRVHRCPMVFEVRDLWPEVPIAVGALRGPFAKAAARALERAAYRASAHVVALSPGMRDGVLKTGYPADRITVIPNLANPALFRDPAALEDMTYRRMLGAGPIVVYTGVIGYVNGLEYLVRLARETRRYLPEVRFVIVGAGKERAAVERAAREAGVLETTLRILPLVPKTEIPKILAAADVATSFVRDIPALWENSANKFFDALAAGKPVLINHGGWQADLLRATGAGIVVPAADPAAGARLLADFLADRDRLQRAGAAALELARSNFDVEKLSGAALTVLERAVSTLAARGASRDSIVIPRG
jgi:glycosyltransferase involved in cell wall biosynthesis